MEVSNQNLCMGCMSVKDYDGPCKRCGYSGTEPYDIDYLPPQSKLQEKYLVGKRLSANGESALYIGYHLEEDCKVLIRELMPRSLVSRSHSDLHLRPLRGQEALYKGIIVEFEELCGTLMSMSSIRGIVPILETFRENGTVYAVYRFVNTISLGTLLNRCGGEIKWSSCRKMFLQLLNTVSQVHKKGIIHAGISPQTILIDEKGTAYLFEFSVYELRSAKGSLSGELFEGYSAPEQYHSNEQYGEWTDVYALGAVLYRVVTGTMPPSAPSREISDNLVDACELDASIPENVSNAIRSAMVLPVGERTPSVDAFSCALLENSEGNTAIYDAQSSSVQTAKKPEGGESSPGSPDSKPLSRRQQRKAEKQEQKRAKKELKAQKRRKHPRRAAFLSVFIPMLLTIIVLGVLLLLFVRYKYEDFQKSVSQYFSDSSISSASESSASGSAASNTSSASSAERVPNFVGQYIDTISSNEDYQARYDLTIYEEYNDEYPKGIIFRQSPAADTLMANHGTVLLYVSKGTDALELPDLSGSTLELAIKTLTDQELKYSVIEVANPDYQEGLVAYTLPAAGTTVRKNDEIILFTKMPMEEEEESSSSSSQSSSSSSSKPKAKKVLRDESSESSPWD